MINNEEIRIPFKLSGRNSEIGILSHAIANTDDLVRKVQSLVLENRKLKQKYKSLSQSAVQVKQLYEQERDNSQKLLTQNVELKKINGTLKGKNSELEHCRINMQLTHSQALAELELKQNQENEKSNNALKELIVQCRDLNDVDTKFKSAVKQGIDLLDKRGVEIQKLSVTKSSGKRRRKERVDDDSISIASESCSTIFEENESIQMPDTTQSLQNDLQNQIKDENSSNEINNEDEAPPKKIFVSVETNTDRKSYCDKATSYVSSLTTRGVSTECFIRKIDIGTNFPEPTNLSISDIFKEMIIETPLLLSPIPENAPSIGRGTQTDPVQTETKSVASNSCETRTVSTHTKLRNIRKPIGYCQNSQKTLPFIKKEEEFVSQFDVNMQSSIDTDINPQLTQLWIILGKLLFGLIGNGQIFNSSVVNGSLGRTWEQIQEISELIETRTLREEQLADYAKTLSTQSGKDNFESEIDDEDERDEINSETIVPSQISISETESRTDKENEASEMEITETVPEQNESSIENSVNMSNEPDSIKDKESPLRPTPITSLMSPIKSPVPSTSRCVSPVTPPSQQTLETTPRPIKRKFADNQVQQSPINSEISNEISSQCSLILSSAKRRRENFDNLISPIKESPKPVSKNRSSISLADLFGESDDDDDDEHKNEINEKNANKNSDIDENMINSILEEESPASPPDWCKVPKIQESQIIPLEKYDDDYSPMSPQMPSSDEITVYSKPVVIPLDDPEIESSPKPKKSKKKSHVPPESVLHQVINEYDRSIRNKVVTKTMQCNKETPKMSHQIEVLRKSITEFLEGEWTSATTQILCDKCVKFNEEIVIKAIIETIEDNFDDPINMENTPPAPPLPLTHQKLILVVCKMPSNFKDTLIETLDGKIFTLTSNKDKKTLEVLMSLAHFYIGLTDIESPGQEKSRARLFIYKALYYYNHKSFPLIYAMLAAQPNCLPKTSNQFYKNDDPMVTTIKSILMNSPKDKLERSEFKKKELRAMLITQYGYLPFKPHTDHVITELVDYLKKNQLKNLDYAFILLAKRYGYEWAMSKIIKAHLYPMLEQLMALSMETDEHDGKIMCILKVISAILKTYPADVNTTYFLQLFKTVLDRSEKPLIQEAAVEALLRFQRFSYSDVYQRLRKWSPNHTISPKLVMMLKTFVYRKDLKFWINLSKTPS